MKFRDYVCGFFVLDWLFGLFKSNEHKDTDSCDSSDRHYGMMDNFDMHHHTGSHSGNSYSHYDGNSYNWHGNDFWNEHDDYDMMDDDF